MARDDARLALLERQLRALGPELAVPDARGIAPAVRHRIESGTTRLDVTDVARSPRRRHPVLVAVAVALLLAIGLTLAIGESRDAVADFFGLRGVEVEHSPEPLRTFDTDLDLGRPVSRATALDTVGFIPFVPPRARYGAPDGIYVANHPAGGRVTFVYAPSADLPPAAGSNVGLLVTEFEATIEEPVIRKTAGPDTTVETLEVNGQRAFWLEGAPHGVVFTDRNGKGFQDRVRLSGNTLLFANGSRTIRIESGLTKAHALALAASMEPMR